MCKGHSILERCLFLYIEIHQKMIVSNTHIEYQIYVDLLEIGHSYSLRLLYCGIYLSILLVLQREGFLIILNLTLFYTYVI